MDNPDDVLSKARAQSKSGGGGPPPGPPKQPWDVEVDVYLTKGCPDPKFKLTTSLPRNGDDLVFENNRRPGFNVRFNLYDETGEGYVFPPQPKVSDACWSQAGTTCPTLPVSKVFEPRRVENGGTTLVVYNDNPSPAIGPFKYTLRVTKDGGATYCDLDPGGLDGNGARS
jgi:hypothetical protein